MCNHALHPLLADLPKCEHHMHLEGALPPSLLFSLADTNHIALPSPTADPSFASPAALLARYTRFTSLDDFLSYYFVGMSVLLHAADFEALAWSYFQRAHADGVVHAELFFDPQAHTARGVEYKTVMEGFERARERAEKEFGISSQLIVCFLRHLPVQGAEEAFEEAKADLEQGRLAGIGIDSSEVGYPAKLFERVYGRAKEAGFRRTAHAGEEAGAQYVRDAIKYLDVQRVDHGIRMGDDEDLMEEVARKGMLVTVCPISNLRLRCVKNIGELPIRKFLDKGVKFSINSDDPAYFTGYILDNYCAVQEAFNLTVGEWEGIGKAAIEGSWCERARKKEMLGMLEAVIAKYRTT